MGWYPGVKYSYRHYYCFTCWFLTWLSSAIAWPHSVFAQPGETFIGAQLFSSLPSGGSGYTGLVRTAGRPNDIFASRINGEIYRIDVTNGESSLFTTIPDVSFGFWHGLLGTAFHPDFENNGKLYVHMSADRDGNMGPAEGVHHRTYIREFTLNDHLTAAPTIDPSATRNLLRWDQPGQDHNGGWIGFQPGDPDTLWITSGDGRNQDSDRDPHRNGQNATNLLSTILRVDISGSGAGEFGNYAIPANNPNATGDPQFAGWEPEIWSIGLRSPWGGSFDRETGDFMFGEVGSWPNSMLVDGGPEVVGGGYEELNFERAGSDGGRNYGWRVMEGNFCSPSQDGGPPCNDPGFTDPIHNYAHSGGFGTGDAQPFRGRSITGGYVYRGPIEELQGRYVFGDWSSRQVWSLEIDRDVNGGLGGVVAGSLQDHSCDFDRATSYCAASGNSTNGVVAFGEDATGNLYFMELSGQVFMIDELELPPPPPPPPVLTPVVYRDDFDSNHNYQTGTVPEGGIWSGVHNENNGGNGFDANISNEDDLTLGIQGVGWESNANSTGRMLYREVEADELLEVRIKISDQAVGNWSNAGIIVRVPGEIGENENFVTAQSYRISGTNLRAAMSNVIDGNEVAEPFEPVDNIDELMFVRLVSHGEGEFEMFTSSTGEDEDWISQNTIISPGLALAQEMSSMVEVGLWAGSFVNGVAGTAQFDWAEIILGVPSGDYNGDGVIDAADYTVWRDTLGGEVDPWTGADGNGDGMVDEEDFDAWVGNFGATIPNGQGGQIASPAAVPEPASAWLLLLAIGSLWGQRRRVAG